MSKIEDLQDVRIKELVKKLIREDISMYWLRDILQQKRFKVSNYGREFELVDFFDVCIWDNLNPNQQGKVIEALNLLIEEDLFAEKAYEDNYCFRLLDFAILFHKKFPGEINIKPFLLWKEKKYPNVALKPEDLEHPNFKRLSERIERIFIK